MRLAIAAALFALTACSPAEETASAPDAAKPAESAAAQDPHAGHDMGPMDGAMSASDAADDVAALTPDNHTFHTYPAKLETVRLQSTEGGFWTMQGEVPANLALTGTGMEDMPDGSKAYAARFEMKASGNATIVFERRGSDNADDPVLEVRTVNFMVH